MSKEENGNGLYLYLKRWFLIEKYELAALVYSFIFFFTLLSTNYILRPFRDEMGIAGGIENLPWLFTATFISMLTVVPIFAWLTKRYPRKRFLPYVYIFFTLNILTFYVLFNLGFDHAVLARIFFVWLSVFNVFVVSVFWSFMIDVYTNEQSKRLFGIIAAGGSAGAIAGPAIAASLSVPLGPVNLLLIAAGMLLFSTVCIFSLVSWSKKFQLKNISNGSGEDINQKPIGGGILDGIKAVFTSRYLLGICLLIICYSSVSTFLYFEQANIVRDTIKDSAQRTALFASIDLATNIIAISSQLFVTNRFIKKFGLAILLAFIPVLDIIGLLTLSIATVLPVLIVVQVIHRAGEFSLSRPGREVLYTVTSRKERYKAKNFIDTAVYRGSDALISWVFAGLTGIGFGLSAMALFAVPIAAIWAVNGLIMGKKQQIKKEQMELFKKENENPATVVNLNKN
ncbi:MAG: MFS transporter [Ignavibacteriae bacterium]|nr:MAG: MFS transporter [Ignavibacteriota bacterium]